MTSTEVRRRTRQRSAISTHLGRTQGFQTAQQIFDGLRQQGTAVSLPTVYRTLATMVELGELDHLITDGQAVYRRCSPHHHHHLMCRACGRTIELIEDPVESWATAVAETHHFIEINHVTEITGICPDCQ